MKVKVGVSARHVHLSLEDYKELFGEDEFVNIKDLRQPGEFASNKQVTIIGPKKKIERVRVLGPLRSYTQVEVSKTDTITLGITAPVRNSGELSDASEIIITSEKSEIKRKAAIIATRHIHINAKDALELGVKNNDTTSVKVTTGKGGIMDQVYYKVNNNSAFEFHIDTDDANAFMITNEMELEIISK